MARLYDKTNYSILGGHGDRSISPFQTPCPIRFPIQIFIHIPCPANTDRVDCEAEIVVASPGNKSLLSLLSACTIMFKAHHDAVIRLPPYMPPPNMPPPAPPCLV
jgi:hypothetical protein